MTLTTAQDYIEKMKQKAYQYSKNGVLTPKQFAAVIGVEPSTASEIIKDEVKNVIKRKKRPCIHKKRQSFTILIPLASVIEYINEYFEVSS